MEKTNEITIAILTFQEITQIQDTEVAIKYLSENDWDVEKSVYQYFSEGNGQAQEGPPKPYHVEQLVEEDKGLAEIEEHESLLKRIKNRVLSLLTPSSYAKEGKEEKFVYLFDKKFSKLLKPKFFAGKLESAIQEATLKRKPLLIYIHNHKESELIKYFIENTICNVDAVPFLNQNFVVFGADADTVEGKKVMQTLGIAKLPYISVRISSNYDISNILYQTDKITTSKVQFLSELENVVKNYHAIVGKIEGEESFEDVKAVEPEGKKDDKPSLEYEENKEVTPEPDLMNPDACELAFRLPSGRRIVRRFLKTAKLQTLRTFLDTTDELNGKNYEISQPIAKKIYRNTNATLEEEGLYPKAFIQIGLL